MSIGSSRGPLLRDHATASEEAADFCRAKGAIPDGGLVDRSVDGKVASVARGALAHQERVGGSNNSGRSVVKRAGHNAVDANA